MSTKILDSSVEGAGTLVGFLLCVTCLEDGEREMMCPFQARDYIRRFLKSINIHLI